MPADVFCFFSTDTTLRHAGYGMHAVFKPRSIDGNLPFGDLGCQLLFKVLIADDI